MKQKLVLTQEEWDIAFEKGEAFLCDEWLVWCNLLKLCRKVLKNPTLESMELMEGLYEKLKIIKKKNMTHEETDKYRDKYGYKSLERSIDIK